MTQLCPDFYFGELDKNQARQLRDLARRVALSCTLHGRGDDLLAYVYCAGLYHGSTTHLPTQDGVDA